MIAKFFNLSIKSKIIAIVVIVFVIATAAVVTIRTNQMQAQINLLMEERLAGNANMTFGIFDTVKVYTMWLLDLAANHARYGLTTGSDMARDLSYLFDSVNHAENGVHAYENILVFDTYFNIAAVANPLA